MQMIAPMSRTAARIARRDVVFAVVLSALGVLLMVDNVATRDEWRSDPEARAAVHVGNLLPYELIIPLFLLVTVPLLWRRVAPAPAIAAACAGLLVNYALTGTEALRCGVVLLTAFLFAFTAGTRDSRAGLALSAALVALSIAIEITPLTMTVFFVAVVGTFWGVGRIARTRSRMAQELRERTVELREARDERARLQVTADRARLSRELDDVLQRRLAALARLADGAHANDTADARAAFAQIERESRRALQEMRAAVGVLRDESGSGLEPQPALTQLEGLLLSAKGAGARLRVDGDPRVLPPAIELSAYRIVEQLLAALEDSPDIEVRVTFRDEALELAVAGPARRRARASLERARERARLQDGSFEATLRSGRAEALVSLPVLAVV